jgi:DNA-binding NtrC family response regulator
MKAFLQHHWLGNVRELENMIQRLVVLGNEKAILEDLTSVVKRDAPPEKKKTSSTGREWPSLKEVQREAAKKAESQIILEALEMTNWNRKKAAMALNLSYKALLYKIKDFALDRRSAPTAS